MTRDSYVPRAVSIHSDKYGYDRVPSEFRATYKIEIFCRDTEKKMKCEEHGISLLYVTDSMELNDICHCHVGNLYTEMNTINKHSLKDKLTEIRE